MADTPNISSKLMTDAQREIMARRILRQGESPEQMVRRVVGHIAQAASESPAVADAFERMFSSLDFLPNSPTLCGAGTALNQLAACFVLPVSDDLGREPDSIFLTLRKAVLIQQSGGGVGFDFSPLRPRGDEVASTKGISSGPVSFISIFDKAIGEIAQGGMRRGASMAVLRVDHPDILDFISCKAQEGRISNFNISVALTDKFMDCLRDGKQFELINPRTQRVERAVSPELILTQITDRMIANGEPGILFPEKANRLNAMCHKYTLRSTNPCGEQWLGPYENCCLGSINLANHITPAGMDWPALQRTTELAVRFLDDVITANKYIPEIPELEQAAKAARRIGLGITGLADVLIALRLPYDSPRAREFAGYVMANIKLWSLAASIKLAEERVPFGAFEGSLWATTPGRLIPPQLGITDTFGGELTEANYAARRADILAGIGRHGLRNAALTCIAPTGTLSTLMGVYGYGCEPLIGLSYKRNVVGQSAPLIFNCRLLERALEGFPAAASIRAEVAATGRMPREYLRAGGEFEHFKCAPDISADDHLSMQETLQKWVDNSISKTVNCSAQSATPSTVRDLIVRAHNSPHVKGFTLYVIGSRAKEVIVMPQQKHSRPPTLQGKTTAVETAFGTVFVTANSTPGGQPFEMFVNIGKGGTDLAAISEGYGRLISLLLRIESPVAPATRLGMIRDQMRNIGGSSRKRSGGHTILSLPDAIAQAIAPDAEAPTAATGAASTMELCALCRNLSVIFAEGCRRCVNCGASSCA